MQFKDLIDNGGSGVYYKNVSIIKKEIENINEDFISKKRIIPNSLKDVLLDESITYCFNEYYVDGNMKSYRDYNNKCTSVSFYYEYNGTIFLSIKKTNSGKITRKCIFAWDDIYIERIYKAICKIDRNNIISEIVNE